MDRPGLAIVIPAYNERDSIAEVARAAAGHGVVIVVDDASGDGTAQAARQAGALVVTHALNQGYDAALNSGFAKAAELGCAAVVTIDADGQHPAGLLGLFAARLADGVDVVAGCRPSKPRLAERLFGLATRLLCGVKDPLCGMKGYRMSLYRELGHFDSYGSIGSELLLFAARNNKRIEQIPVPIAARRGRSRFGAGLGSNIRIFRAMVKGLARWRSQTWTASCGARKATATPKGR
ncbi:glycosyltransferase family 2 protein [Desulfarculus baarsii]